MVRKTHKGLTGIYEAILIATNDYINIYQLLRYVIKNLTLIFDFYTPPIPVSLT